MSLTISSQLFEHLNVGDTRKCIG